MKKIIIVAILVVFLINVALGHNHRSAGSRDNRQTQRWNDRRDYHHGGSTESTSSSYQRNHGNRRHHNHHYRGSSDENQVKSDSDYLDWYNNRRNQYDSQQQQQQQNSNSNSISNTNSDSYWYGSGNSFAQSSVSSQSSSFDWSYYFSSSSFEVNNDIMLNGVGFVIVFSLVSLLLILTTFTCNSDRRSYTPVTQL